MNIPQNFDKWVFDYMEGNLSSKEIETFEQFLLQNPDYQMDADAWQNATIANDDLVYPEQHTLIRKKKVAGWVAWSAAAMITILIGTGVYLALNTNTTNLANNTPFFRENNSTLSNSVWENRSRTNISVSESNEIDNKEIIETNLALEIVNLQEDQITENIQNQSGSNTGFSSYNEQLIKQNNENNTNALAENTERINNNNSQDNEYNNGSYTIDPFANSTSNNNANAINKNRTNKTTGTDKSVNKYNKSLNRSIKQAQEKYKTTNNNSTYLENPSINFNDLDLAKKRKNNYNTFGNATKRVYRKIEKMMGYPVGLVNLRDPELILPENSLTDFNPGFTGGMLKPRLEMKYRNQWLGEKMNAHKSEISFDNYFTQMKGGIGVSLNSAIYADGAFGDQSINLRYSPKISIIKNIVFEPGIKITLGTLISQSTKLESNQNVELERGLLIENQGINTINKMEYLWYKDYGLGFVLNTKWFYAGFSADNLNRHFSNIYNIETSDEPQRTPILFNTIIGADYESANKSMTISPFISARKIGEIQEAWAGLNYRINHFTIGGSYSTNKDFTAAIGIKFKKFKLVYQYDYTHTLLTTEQIGSHSIGIRFNGDLKKSRFKY